MQISDAKLYKMFGLDAYQEKYGEYIHDVETTLLETQYESVGKFVIENAPNISETNYIILIQIQDELWIRDMFNNYNKKES